MGTIKRGILGGFSGSVANVVGSSWKGIAVMKSKPLSVANPNTAAQQTQRTKMTNVVAFALVLLQQIIKPLNDRFASGQSGFNLFVQRNIALFTTVDPTPPNTLILSSGSVEPADTFAVAGDVGLGDINLTWVDNTGTGNALATDVPYGAVFNRTTNEVVPCFSAGTDRSTAAMTIAMPAGWLAGHILDGWLSFRRADGTQVSDTAYDQGVVA